MAYDPAAQAWMAPQGSYGYNWIGTGELPPATGASVLHLGLGAMALRPDATAEPTRKESEVAVPADMAELGDGGGGQISPPTAVTPDYHRFAHRDLLNVTFCDGHAESPRGYVFYQPTPEARRRFNYDNQPHPETWEDEADDKQSPPPPKRTVDADGDDAKAPARRRE